MTVITTVDSAGVDSTVNITWYLVYRLIHVTSTIFTSEVTTVIWQHPSLLSSLQSGFKTQKHGPFDTVNTSLTNTWHSYSGEYCHWNQYKSGE